LGNSSTCGLRCAADSSRPASINAFIFSKSMPIQRAIQGPNSQARLVIDVFRHRNWKSGSVNRDVQLRALNVTHCRCPGTELNEGGHSQVRSTAAQPSLYPPTPGWPTNGRRLRGTRCGALPLAHRKLDRWVPQWICGKCLRTRPWRAFPSGRNSDRTSELRQ
jgi:hypothetical protein